MVRVMCQAQEIAPQLLGMPVSSGDVLPIAVFPLARVVFMNADSSQEQRFPIQPHLGALDLDLPESYPIVNPVLSVANEDLVTARRFGRPQLRLHLDRLLAYSVAKGEPPPQVELRDLHSHISSGIRV